MVFIWVLAYGKAIAVDGADVMLTLAFLRKITEEEKSGWDYAKIAMILLFIVGFTCFSWYINWQYEKEFVTTEFALADAQTFFFGMNVGTTNPAVGSAFQLFALIFTFISDIIMKKPDDVKPAKSMEELRKEAEDAGERARYERQILEAKKSVKTGLIGKIGEAALEVKRTAKKVATDGSEASPEDSPKPVKTEVVVEETDVVFTVAETSDMNETTEVESDDVEGVSEDMLAEGKLEVIGSSDAEEDGRTTDPELEALNVTNFPENGRKTNAKVTVPLTAIDITTRRKPLTVSEVIQVLGVSEKTVREWKRLGKLSVSSDGKSLTVSSVRKVLESRQERVS